ncbi:MAG: hypothetical protein F7O42_12530 [Opitutae bacterium]|nr:hypothetical protein [Opitutae bacterium]
MRDMAARQTAPPDSGNESSCHRKGDEAQQVGEPESADQETANPRGYGADDQRAGRGSEELWAIPLHGSGNGGHRQHEHGRQPRDSAAEPSRQRDKQTGGEVSEQHQADALGGIRGQRSGEYEGPEGHLSYQQGETGGKSGRQRRKGQRGWKLGTKPAANMLMRGFHPETLSSVPNHVTRPSLCRVEPLDLRSVAKHGLGEAW